MLHKFIKLQPLCISWFVDVSATAAVFVSKGTSNLSITHVSSVSSGPATLAISVDLQQ